MIVIGQNAVRVLSSALALGLVVGTPLQARADALSVAVPALVAPAVAPRTVSLVTGGSESSFSTTAPTVGAFLAERAVRPAADDYVSSPLDAPLSEGERIVYRAAVPVTLVVAGVARVVRSAAPTVGDLLREQHVAARSSDEVDPGATEPLAAGTVRVAHLRTWTVARRERISFGTKRRDDPRLPQGLTRVAQAGVPGVRETQLRFVRRDGSAPERSVLASRILRLPRPRVIVRGVGTYASLAHVAALGFASALHFAGAALHVIATAYSAGCPGCNGLTASGVRAGHGVVAVDPRVIPLGTHLFVPGYGRAVAGDTGGSIVGRRVDLGFDSLAEAAAFGRRDVTVYVVR